MNKLLIRGEPVGPFQHLYVFENDKVIETLGVSIEDLEDTALALIEKYNINYINLSGAKMYMQGIEEKLKKAGITTYNINNLTFRYV